MAGCIAGVLNQEAEIFEAGDGKTQHQAVLRFRSPAVGEAIGIPFKKVRVYKSIVINGGFAHHDIRNMNMYSYKVTGTYHDRSIANIKTEDRWVAPENFHDMLKEMCDGRIFFNKSVNSLDGIEDSGPIISTIPIDVLARIVGEDFYIEGQKKSIYVSKFKIDGADLQQTIYFPDSATPVYRATMTGDIMRVESMEKAMNPDIDQVFIAFGMASNWTIIEEKPILWNHKQPIGKLLPIDEEFRRRFIRKMTEKYGIYSLGRFATWRNILLDDVLKDIHQIRKMINQDHYANRLETI